MTKKLDIILGGIVFIAFVSSLLILQYLRKDTEKVCAKFSYTFRGKSTRYYVFKYEVNGVTVEGTCVGLNLKIKDPDKLKSFDCIEIAYAKSEPTFIKITDKIVGDTGW